MTIKSQIFAFLAVGMLVLPSTAWAFCGFYVGGAGADLYADATQVALMRVNDHTALSMSNRYDGPAEDFAMVIPVPVVLMQDDVKTLPDDLFGAIDRLSAPRLVEYWEEDPCYVYQDEYLNNANNTNNFNNFNNTNNGVVVEAQFAVGEYDISILSSDDSTALEGWLSTNNYNIPAGAGPYLEPYVQSGMYFFVAKVDITKVKTVNGKTVLSPLRFTYQSDDFSLPVRLGMINSQGKQDLLVYIVAPQGQRYEVSNYPNTTIPTNLNVVDEVRDNFGAFYEALFARTLKENPGAVVTEYSWVASKCDPCPGPVVAEADLLTLGADVLPGADASDLGWVLTRLHARYDKDEVGEDLIFKKAEPIVGGREMRTGNGKLEQGASAASLNNFQGRYIIRHPWTGKIDCEDPIRGRWGGENGGGPQVSANPSPNTTGTDPFLDGGEVDPWLRSTAPEIGVTDVEDPYEEPTGGSSTDDGGCSSASIESTVPISVLLFVGLIGFVRRRRR